MMVMMQGVNDDRADQRRDGWNDDNDDDDDTGVNGDGMISEDMIKGTVMMVMMMCS